MWPNWTDAPRGPSVWAVTAFRDRARYGCSHSTFGEAFRGQGVGTALVNGVEAAAADRALTEVNLEVAIGNEDAFRLYQRLGYKRLGKPVLDRWEQPLDDGGSRLVEEPSWVMIKSLG